MRILFISDRGQGGIRNHVKILLQSLQKIDGVETYCIGEDEPFSGKSGHDPRELFQIRCVVKWFKPDIVHFHTLPFWMVVYVKLIVKLPVVCSIHIPYEKNTSYKMRFLFYLIRKSYFLPVSKSTWEVFRRYQLPNASGEVFYNSMCISTTSHNNAVDAELFKERASR